MPVNINTITQSNFIRRVFGLVSGFRLTLDEIIVPVVVLEDATVTSRADDVPCFGGADRAAVAGEFSHISLFNDVGSNLLVTLEEIWISAQPSAFCQFRGGGRTGATINPSYRDSRLWLRAGIPQVPITRIVSGTNAAILGSARATPVLASSGQATVLRPGIILEEGDDITIVANVINTSLRVLFLFRETPLD